MKEVIAVWMIRKVLIPFAFWLDDEHHKWVHKTMDEIAEAKREGLTLHQYRVKHSRS
jgi:hypothetical protein